MTIAFHLCSRICHQEGPRKWGLDGTYQLLIYADDVSMLG